MLVCLIGPVFLCFVLFCIVLFCFVLSLPPLLPSHPHPAPQPQLRIIWGSLAAWAAWADLAGTVPSRWLDGA